MRHTFLPGFGTLLAGLLLIVGLGNARAQVINGGFESGALAPWTAFTTPNGTFGPGLPVVSMFDVDGDGVPSSALSASVGYLRAPCAAPGVLCPLPTEGAGVRQAASFAGGLTTLRADVAVSNSTLLGGFNSDGGTFALMLDGALLDSISFVDIAAGAVERGHLDFTGLVSGGLHTVELLITRHYSSSASLTQYIDSVTTVAAVPEPSTALLVGTGMLAMLGASKRRRT